jgi:hypothetical protein
MCAAYIIPVPRPIRHSLLLAAAIGFDATGTNIRSASSSVGLIDLQPGRRDMLFFLGDEFFIGRLGDDASRSAVEARAIDRRLSPNTSSSAARPTLSASQRRQERYTWGL